MKNVKHLADVKPEMQKSQKDNLKAKYVIHTVGPIYDSSRKEECRVALKSCYQKSLELAKENGCESIAFPLISAGVYGYPKKEALEVAVETIEEFGEGLDCSIILFDKSGYFNTKQKKYDKLFIGFIYECGLQ